MIYKNNKGKDCRAVKGAIMQIIKIYKITEEEAKRTDFRPVDRQVETMEVEDGWTYQDVIENQANYSCALEHECADLYIWRVEDFDGNVVEYIAEVKEIEMFYFVDSNLSAASTESIKHFPNAAEALAEAQMVWEHLTDSERNARDAFYVGKGYPSRDDVLSDVLPDLEIIRDWKSE